MPRVVVKESDHQTTADGYVQSLDDNLDNWDFLVERGGGSVGLRGVLMDPKGALSSQIHAAIEGGNGSRPPYLLRTAIDRAALVNTMHRKALKRDVDGIQYMVKRTD
ncbi:hypothetical protein I316_05412 [Kwoniella heveanensis BCC8398]|uniref:Uncharacterized protein n=1 Tax=Kwoniella heveanensis BCC8398 TaxID=1296120 RepID=A0A1B9GP26_9TREE|nr:hypothetical protein I316_05412 [Kwoniella heveanensis BCC8398]